MLKELESLAAAEVDLLMKAPLLVCILIAGADDQIDRKEMAGALSLAKNGKAKSSLIKFYESATEDFEDKLKILISGFPLSSAQRNPLITKELSGLNTIFPKLKMNFASDLYKSFLHIATAIAQSSGCLLKRVGNEEALLVSLPMVKDPKTS